MLLTYLDVIAISYPPRVRVRATVKLSAMFFHDESSITKWGEGGYKSAILAPLLTYLLTYFGTVDKKLSDFLADFIC